MPEDEAARQIAQSRRAPETLLGTKVMSFAYPGGAQSSIHRHMVRDAGYSLAVTVKRGKAGKDHDPFGLPRATVRRSDTVLHFLKKVLI